MDVDKLSQANRGVTYDAEKLLRYNSVQLTVPLAPDSWQ